MITLTMKEDKNMKEERTAKEWIKEHKAELICGGVGIAAVVGLLLGIKNCDECSLTHNDLYMQSYKNSYEDD